MGQHLRLTVLLECGVIFAFMKAVLFCVLFCGAVSLSAQEAVITAKPVYPNAERLKMVWSDDLAGLRGVPSFYLNEPEGVPELKPVLDAYRIAFHRAGVPIKSSSPCVLYVVPDIGQPFKLGDRYGVSVRLEVRALVQSMEGKWILATIWSGRPKVATLAGSETLADFMIKASEGQIVSEFASAWLRANSQQ